MKSSPPESRSWPPKAVAPVYSTPDPAIARQQLEELRTVLAYISNVRADTYASPEQKLTDLAALENVTLDRDTSQAILALSDTRWQIGQPGSRSSCWSR